MMKYLQKLGKALMLPVAALPVCGILMGLGIVGLLAIITVIIWRIWRRKHEKS